MSPADPVGAAPGARPPRAPEAAIRTGLAVGPILACVGIAWTAIAPSAFSSAAVLAGLVACFYATHRFGRLGAEDGGVAPAPTEAARASALTREAREAREARDAEGAVEAERLRKSREEARARAKRGD